MKRAKGRFLEENANYDRHGRPMERRCVAILTRFYEDEHRSSRIRETAGKAISHVEHFQSVSAIATSRLALAAQAQYAVMLNLQVQAVADSRKALGTGKRLDEATYMTPGSVATDLLIHCFELASSTYSLRLAGLAKFLGEDGPEPPSLVEATVYFAAKRGPEVVVKQLISSLLPPFSIVKDVVEILDQVKTAIGRREFVYKGRNQVDDLDDFADWLAQQAEILEGTSNALEKDSDALVAAVHSSALRE